PSLPVRVAISMSDELHTSIDQTARVESTATAAWYALRLRAHDPALRPSFDRLLAPGALHERLRPHPYQLRVVEQALTMTATGVILADEVGLGKTIEAGLLYTDLALRGLAHTVLILAPKSLLPQWQAQLRELFDADFALTDEKRFSGFESEPRLICSLQQ